MSTPFIQTADQIIALRTAAEGWVGTPFASNGVIRGQGCCCQQLPSAVLRELGHTHPDAPGRGTLRKCEILPTMRAWLAGHPECFSPVALPSTDNRPPSAGIQPGDVILINAGTGHLGLALDRGEMLHVWQHAGAHISNHLDLVDRIVGVWRPLA